MTWKSRFILSSPASFIYQWLWSLKLKMLHLQGNLLMNMCRYRTWVPDDQDIKHLIIKANPKHSVLFRQKQLLQLIIICTIYVVDCQYVLYMCSIKQCSGASMTLNVLHVQEKVSPGVSLARKYATLLWCKWASHTESSSNSILRNLSWCLSAGFPNCILNCYF